MKQIDSYRILGAPGSEGRQKYLSVPAKQYGSPPAAGPFLLTPAGKEVLLKSSAPAEGDTLLLELKGAAAPEIAAGSFLIPASQGAAEGKRALVIWKGSPPGNGPLDLSLRDLPDYPAKKVSSNRKDRISQISGPAPFLQIPGQIYRLQGRAYEGECVLLMTDPFTPEEAKQMVKRAGKFGNFPGRSSIYSMNLRIRGYACVPEDLTEDEFDGAQRKGRWMVLSRVGERWTRTMEKRSRSEEGIREADLSRLLGCPEDLVRELAAALIAQGKVIRSQGVLLNATETPEQFLSPLTRSFYTELKQAGGEGLPLQDAVSRGAAGLPDILRRRGLARTLDTRIFSEEAYASLREQIRAAAPEGRPFDLSDLTGKAGVSRGVLLRILEEMESDGLLRSLRGSKREFV